MKRFLLRVVVGVWVVLLAGTVGLWISSYAFEFGTAWGPRDDRHQAFCRQGKIAHVRHGGLSVAPGPPVYVTPILDDAEPWRQLPAIQIEANRRFLGFERASGTYSPGRYAARKPTAPPLPGTHLAFVWVVVPLWAPAVALALPALGWVRRSRRRHEAPEPVA